MSSIKQYKSFYINAYMSDTDVTNGTITIQTPSFNIDESKYVISGVYLQSYCMNFKQDVNNDSQIYFLNIGNVSSGVFNSNNSNHKGIPMIFRTASMGENCLDGNGTVVGAASSLYSRASVWGEYSGRTYPLALNNTLNESVLTVKIYDPYNQSFLTGTEVQQLFLMLRIDIDYINILQNEER